MTSNLRVLYVITGGFLVLAVVHVNHMTHLSISGWHLVVWPEPFGTFAGYLFSALGFYLLSDAAVGAKLPTRHWWMHIVVALTLAAVLVAGMALYRMWFPPPVPGDWLDG